MEEHVTLVHILAQDNVKYLYTLEKFTQPLYRLDPTKIGDYLPALMYAIRMIYATSRFFNTRRMVTAVYVKVLFLELYFTTILILIAVSEICVGYKISQILFVFMIFFF